MGPSMAGRAEKEHPQVWGVVVDHFTSGMSQNPASAVICAVKRGSG